MNTLHARLRRVQVRTYLMALGLFLIVLIAAGYAFDWPQWTGFGDQNLFDWLKILFFPAAVAVGTFVLNQAAKKRDQEKEQRAQEIILRREFRKDLLQTYNAVKRVRRALRAKTSAHHGEPQKIAMKTYDELMQELLDIQLRFELLRDEADVLFPVHAGVERHSKVRCALVKSESYLAEIIKEYEDRKDEANEWKLISEGSQLAKFIRRSRTDKTFKTSLSARVHEVEAIVLEELLSPPEESSS
jgi:intein/homing endonuclease